MALRSTYHSLVILTLALATLLKTVNCECKDYYIFKDAQQDSQAQASYQTENQRKKSDIPQTRGMVIIPFMSKAQILQQKSVNLNTVDVDQEFYERGLTNYDYIIPICVDSTTFMVKIDLGTSMLYLASTQLDTESYSKYSNALSLAYENLYATSKRCIFSDPLSPQEDQQTGSQPQPKNDKSQANETPLCSFKIWDPVLNYTFSGDYTLDSINVDFAGKQRQKLIKIDEKVVVGNVKSQNAKLLYKNINGLLGMGYFSRDHGYHESFINRIHDIYNLEANVYSMCLNSYYESGGYLIIGGVNPEMYEQPVNWLKFTRVNQLIVDASSLLIGASIVTQKIQVSFDTKTPFIYVTENLLSKLKQQFIQVFCSENLRYRNDKVLCGIENHIMGDTTALVLGKDSDFKSKLPTILIKFDSDGQVFGIDNYIQRCNLLDPNGSSDAWCSAIRKIPQADTATDFVILGSSVLRNYYVIVDNEWSRIGFAQKKGSLCDFAVGDDQILALNDNSIARITVNSLLLVVILFVTIKSTMGCLQFYDFGSSQSCTGNNGHGSGPTEQVHNHQQQEEGKEAESLDEPDGSSYLDDSTMRQDQSFHYSAQERPQPIPRPSSNSSVHNERHVTQTFRPEDNREFERY